MKDKYFNDVNLLDYYKKTMAISSIMSSMRKLIPEHIDVFLEDEQNNIEGVLGTIQGILKTADKYESAESKVDFFVTFLIALEIALRTQYNLSLEDIN